MAATSFCQYNGNNKAGWNANNDVHVKWRISYQQNKNCKQHQVR